MGRIEKTVFISYRRANFWTALAIYQDLHKNGYDVFFDYKSIPSGDFEQVITENIKYRAHFLVVLSPSALERCREPRDWLRREIEFAIDNQRNIIPLMMEGFDFRNSATKKALTGKLSELNKFNAMSIPAEYFEEAMEKLRSDRFLNRSLESISHPVSDITERITEEQKAAAEEASPVEEKQLTAVEWFERGFSNHVVGNYGEAIRNYTEAINIEPDFALAYANRGFSKSDVGDLESAIADYDTAIDLGDESEITYNNRANIYSVKGNYENAIRDFQKSIRINPNYASARISIFGLLNKVGKNAEAKTHKQKACELIKDENEYNRACFESIRGNIDQALELLKIGLELRQSSKDWAKQDPDFDNIRDDPRFKELVGE